MLSLSPHTHKYIDTYMCLYIYIYIRYIYSKGLVSSIFKELSKIDKKQDKTFRKRTKDTDISTNRMANMHVKRCTKSIAIMQVQIKPIISLYSSQKN